MATAEQLASAQLYAALMEEVKIRIFAVDRAVGGHTGLIGPLVREFCYLQLRMVCELIALGCLVAHGDIKETQTKKIRKLWTAKDIIETLEALHPKFYPRPVERTTIAERTTESPGRYHFEGIQSGYLTKADLLQLVGECGGVLHRGSLKKLLSAKTPIQTNFPEIVGHAQKIFNLLHQHAILMQGEAMFFICSMKTIDKGGKVVVTIAEVPPST